MSYTIDSFYKDGENLKRVLGLYINSTRDAGALLLPCNDGWTYEIGVERNWSPGFTIELSTWLKEGTRVAWQPVDVKDIFFASQIFEFTINQINLELNT